MTSGSQDFVEIFQPLTSHEAGMVRAALEVAGIEVYINNGQAFNTGDIRGIGAATMRVMVPAKDVPKATDIIKGMGIK